MWEYRLLGEMLTCNPKMDVHLRSNAMDGYSRSNAFIVFSRKANMNNVHLQAFMANSFALAVKINFKSGMTTPQRF